MLNGAGAGKQTERRLELTEDRRLSRGKTHIARQHELATGAAHATLDLRDGDQAAGAQMTKQAAERRFAGELRRFLPVFADPSHVDVRDEVVGVGAREHEHLDASSASARWISETRSRTSSVPSRFMGGAEISANWADPSLRTATVGAATFDGLIVVLLSLVCSPPRTDWGQEETSDVEEESCGNRLVAPVKPWIFPLEAICMVGSLDTGLTRLDQGADPGSHGRERALRL